MRIDDFDRGINKEILDQYRLLQPQMEFFDSIDRRFKDCISGFDERINTLNLSYLNLESNYNRLFLEMRSKMEPQLSGLSVAMEEFLRITSILEKNISYSGIENALERFQKFTLRDDAYESLSRTITGLSKIFDDDFNSQLEKSFNRLRDVYQNAPYEIDDMWDSISEDDFEDYYVDDQGNLVCDSGITTKNEAQQTILEAITELIDKVNDSWIEFEKKYKIVVLLVRMCISICAAFGKPAAQPLICATEKVISTVNDYDGKYFVSEENVKVYSTPTSKSKVIYHVSYGKTVISEANINGWIKVSITAGDKVYHGWIAKRNLVSYEKAKFHSDELEHDVE